METSVLYKKISRYEKQRTDGFSKEIVMEFKDWLISLERYISDLEEADFEKSQVIFRQSELIEYLVKLIFITGNGGQSIHYRIMDYEELHQAIDFLFKSGDKVNHENLYTIAKLLWIADNDGVEIKDMKELVNYARTGNKY